MISAVKIILKSCYLQQYHDHLTFQVMEAAQASASLGGNFRGVYAVQNVNHIAHLSGALIGVLLIWLLSTVPSPTEGK